MAGDFEQKPPGDGDENQPPPADFSPGKAKKLVWLVAGSCLVVGGLNLTLYLVQCQHQHLNVSILHCLWLSIPLVVGVVLLVKTPALADRINDWLDQ